MSLEPSPCKVEWLEIPAPDLERAGAFYSTVFGWQISRFSSDYWVFQAGNLHGGLMKNRPVSDDGIRFSITVEEITAVLREIEAAGGEIIREKYNLGEELGFCALFKDPNGNRIELWSSH